MVKSCPAGSGVDGDAQTVIGEFDVDSDAMAESFDRAPELSASLVQQSLGESGGLNVVADVSGGAIQAFEHGLGQDPTVGDWTRFSAETDPARYRISLTETGREQLTHPQWSGDGALFLDGRRNRDVWRFRIQFPDEASLQRYVAYCEEKTIPLDPRRLSRSKRSSPTETFGLTPSQTETLVTASERGFFEIPRTCTLEELASSRSVTHQALSERIRRGLDSLIESTLL